MTNNSAPGHVLPRLDPRVWLLALGTFAVGTDANVISGILNQFTTNFHITLHSAGSIVSLYSLTYAISAPILAALTGRMRKDRIAIVALAIFGLANVLCAAAPTYRLLLAARVIAGLGAGLYTPTAYILATSLAAPERKGSALAAVAFGMSGSIVLGVPIGIVVGSGWGWHATFWMIGALSLGSGAVIGWLLPRQQRTIGLGPSISQRLASLVQPNLLLALLPTVLLCVAVQATYTYLGALLLEHGLASGTVMVAIFLSFGVGGLLGSQAGGRLVDRFGSTPVIVVSLFVGLVDTALFPKSLDTAVAVGVTSFMLSFVAWPIVIGQQRRLMKLSPSHAEVLLALNNSCIYLGVAGGATLGALILRYNLGLDRIPLASSLLLVLTLMVYCASLWLQAWAARSCSAKQSFPSEVPDSAPSALSCAGDC